MKRIFKFFLFVCLFFELSRGIASISYSSMRLDHALWHGHDPKLVIAGQIKDAKKREDNAMFIDSPRSLNEKLIFDVKDVILGDESLEGKLLDIAISAFRWDESLVPLKQNSFCILILKSKEDLFLQAVIPSSDQKFLPAKDGEEVKRILAEVLLEELHKETSPTRQRKLILQMAPILTEKESEALVPFLETEDIWLKRAALAGLLYVTEEDRYLKMVQDDLENFIQSIKPGGTISGIDEAMTDPYALLFTHYFFFNSVDWSNEENEKNAKFLPLFRFIAGGEKVPEWVRWRQSIQPIARLGTKADVSTLYDYYRNEQTVERQEILKFPSARQEIFMGISRILDLGLLNLEESEFLNREKEQHQIIRSALIERGIVKPVSVNTAEWLDKIYEKMKISTSGYREVSVKKEDNMITVLHHTKKYRVQDTFKTGEVSKEVREEIGPAGDGFLIKIVLYDSSYVGSSDLGKQDLANPVFDPADSLHTLKRPNYYSTNAFYVFSNYDMLLSAYIDFNDGTNKDILKKLCADIRKFANEIDFFTQDAKS